MVLNKQRHVTRHENKQQFDIVNDYYPVMTICLRLDLVFLHHGGLPLLQV